MAKREVVFGFPFLRYQRLSVFTDNMSGVTPAQFFQHLEATFESIPLSQQRLIQVGPCATRIRSSSKRMDERFNRPLVHLEEPAPGVAPDFTLDFLDVAATSMAFPRLPWPPQQRSVEQQTAEYGEGPFLFTLHGNQVFTASNFSKSRTLGFVRDPRNWLPDHYKQAIFITLYQHLRRYGLQLVHASAIALNNKAILIAGKSGAGKTTAMLSCVQQGFDFLGDDTTILLRSQDRALTVVSLLNTLNVTDQTLAWFPRLRPHVSDPPNAVGKHLVFLNEAYPQRIALQGEVAIILVPEVIDGSETTLEPANKMTLLSELLPYSLDLHDPAQVSEQLAFLVDMLETLPSFRLRLGRDRHRLPGILSSLLAKTPGVAEPAP
ncbi:MAG: hypothetical protein U9R25_18255 [Chloroflexota bacterium]|nr:hypothetical protein [Chloroflexota bacterium]